MWPCRTYHLLLQFHSNCNLDVGIIGADGVIEVDKKGASALHAAASGGHVQAYAYTHPRHARFGLLVLSLRFSRHKSRSLQCTDRRVRPCRLARAHTHRSHICVNTPQSHKIIAHPQAGKQTRCSLIQIECMRLASSPTKATRVTHTALLHTAHQQIHFHRTQLKRAQARPHKCHIYTNHAHAGNTHYRVTHIPWPYSRHTYYGHRRHPHPHAMPCR